MELQGRCLLPCSPAAGKLFLRNTARLYSLLYRWPPWSRNNFICIVPLIARYTVNLDAPCIGPSFVRSVLDDSATRQHRSEAHERSAEQKHDGAENVRSRTVPNEQILGVRNQCLGNLSFYVFTDCRKAIRIYDEAACVLDTLLQVSTRIPPPFTYEEAAIWATHPVFAPNNSTVQGFGTFDKTHPKSLHILGMHGSAYANLAMQQADVIIALGAIQNAYFVSLITPSAKDQQRSRYVPQMRGASSHPSVTQHIKIERNPFAGHSPSLTLSSQTHGQASPKGTPQAQTRLRTRQAVNST
ncbi:hypothetical protein K438DRAFT_1781742 [Mycena galopus ATCC 62051]|nr:hypothetical protein K438DRAFT_1781742 [Mycena galopus ATCC 62051]